MTYGSRPGRHLLMSFTYCAFASRTLYTPRPRPQYRVALQGPEPREVER